MSSERKRLERLEKSVEQIRIGLQKLLEQSQGRRQHKSRRDRHRRATTPLPSPPSLSSEEEDEDDDDFFEDPPLPPMPSLPQKEEEEDDDDFFEEPQFFVSSPKDELSDSLEVIWDKDEELTKEENEELQWILGDFHGVQKKGDEQDLVIVNEPESEKVIEEAYLSGKILRIFPKAFRSSFDQHKQCSKDLDRSSCFSDSLGKQFDGVKHRWKHRKERRLLGRTLRTRFISRGVV